MKVRQHRNRQAVFLFTGFALCLYLAVHEWATPWLWALCLLGIAGFGWWADTIKELESDRRRHGEDDP